MTHGSEQAVGAAGTVLATPYDSPKPSKATSRRPAVLNPVEMTQHRTLPRARSRLIEAAGALVWRERHHQLQVLLVHRPRYDDWSWPKGKVDPGESRATTAVREVQEETGLAVVLGQPLPGLQYLVPDGRVKRVHYWAAQTASDADGPALRARHPVAPVDKHEIDHKEWLGVEEAARRLTRTADRQPLVALLDAHAHGRLSTHAVVVARHGSAVQRAQWAGKEHARPITPTGWAQAAALVPVLAAYGVRDVVTSRWTRCAQTVAPYADASGLETRRHGRLTEAQHERSPARVAATVRELLEAEETSVLCTHRPVLPTVLDVLSEHTGRNVADALPRKDPYLEPGEALVAHVGLTSKGPRVVAAETITPAL
ncbi:NUDIX hydrolase [Luteimicrobium xylanilyticum]|uniref:8-oxo-dGTP diphosphatase n=1 Tax=Luteimicrobium xylanilyticum TaxID=1133546 RepID=A0A5P9QDK1_9MICO|nr:NUDIX hydrolase [Luteimicrobium xylanilyticum]QFU99544.1 8-oxo-dGTP diphosphatase [Luteimicrobium xylanilyticum]